MARPASTTMSLPGRHAHRAQAFTGDATGRDARATRECKGKQWSADRGQEYHQGNMIDEKLLGRITANPEIFGGKPIIRGMRISVEMILSLLAQGEKEETILADYPDLEPDDLRACLAHAHAAISHDKRARAVMSDEL